MKKIFLIIIILLILTLGTFGYIKIFHNDKLSQDEINEIINGYDYSYILNNENLTAGQISKKNILIMVYNSKDFHYDTLFDCTIDECFDLECHPEGEIWDCDNSVQIKCALSYAGFSNVEINQINTNNYSDMCSGIAGGGITTISNLNQIIEQKFGLINYIDLSFLNSLNNSSIDLNCGSFYLYSDPSTNKVLFQEGGGCWAYDDYPILVYLNGYKKNNQYIINVVKGMFIGYEVEGNDYLALVAKSNPNNKIVDKINLEDEKYQGDFEKTLLKKYKDQLDNYKLIFEKVDDTYQFVSVEYIN